MKRKHYGYCYGYCCVVLREPTSRTKQTSCCLHPPIEPQIHGVEASTPLVAYCKRDNKADRQRGGIVRSGVQVRALIENTFKQKKTATNHTCIRDTRLMYRVFCNKYTLLGTDAG